MTNAPRTRGAALGSRILSGANQLWLIALLLLIWWVVSERLSSPLVPSLQEILAALWKQLTVGPMLADLGYSLVNLFAALAAACVVGIGLGLVLGLNRTAYLLIDPLLQYLRSIPKVALVPMFVVFLGIGREPKIIIIALACLWPILLNTIDGVFGMHPTLLDVRRAYRLPRGIMLRRVVLPAIGPQVFAGIRIALGFGVVLLIVSEMYGATRGIGFEILQAGRSFALPETWAGTVALGVLGYLLNLGFEFVERRSLNWHFAAQHAA